MKRNDRMLFVILVILCIITFGFIAYANVAHAKEVTVKLGWDADSTGVWDNLAFYERIGDNPYDYNVPKLELPQTYENGLSTPVTVDIKTDYPDGQLTTKYWVVRAELNGEQSADSEEASFTVDLTPLPNFEFTAAYNKDDKSIDFTWQKNDRVIKWDIFARDDIDGSEFVLVTSVENTDEDMSTSIPIDTLFPDGAETTKIFTMVSHAAFDVFSQNAPEIPITLNRKHPSEVVNFKIILVE